MGMGDKAGLGIGVAFLAVFALIITLSVLGVFLFQFDIAPASGTASGYIYYQEKGGIYQLEAVCWKDTPYNECEWFDPDGRTFEPGKYTMNYECSTFIWAWDSPSLCRITDATRIGDVE